MSLDYKARYKELKAKTLEATNMAYRLGMEAGLQQAAMENAQMQVQQMQAQQAAMQGQQIDPTTGQPIQGGAPAVDQNGQPVDPSMQGTPQGAPVSPEEQAAMEGQPMEEMDQGQASELDMLVNELEELVAKGEKPTVTELRTKVQALSALRKSQKMKMKENKPKEVSAQKSMVDNILKKWSKESELTADNLEDRIKSEGLKL